MPALEWVLHLQELQGWRAGRQNIGNAWFPQTHSRLHIAPLQFQLEGRKDINVHFPTHHRCPYSRWWEWRIGSSQICMVPMYKGYGQEEWIYLASVCTEGGCETLSSITLPLYKIGRFRDQHIGKPGDNKSSHSGACTYVQHLSSSLRMSHLLMCVHSHKRTFVWVSNEGRKTRA